MVRKGSTVRVRQRAWEIPAQAGFLYGVAAHAPRWSPPRCATMSAGMLFRLENVTYARAGRAVLSELSLELAEGTTAVLGASGAGKSTLLRLLNRLADPDAGVISYRGQGVTGYNVLELRR